MQKNIQYFLLIIAINISILKTQQNEAIFDMINLLDKPIYIKQNSSSYEGELLGMNKTQQFTLQFWNQLPNLQNVQEINIFTILNILPKQKEQQQDSTYPDCPYSQNYLRQFPENLNLPSVMSNPNCFINDQSQKKQAKQTQGVMEVDYVFQDNKGFLQITYVSQDENSQNSNVKTLPLIEIKTKSWFFIAIGFDYEKGKASYTVDFNGQPETVEFQLDISQFGLFKNFIVYFSENQQTQFKENFPVLYDLNLHPFYYKDLSILELFNYDQDTAKINNNLLQLDFNKSVNKQIQSEGFYKQKFKIQGNLNVENNQKILKTAYINFKDIMKNILPKLLVKSPTFFYSFQIKEINELILLSLKNKKQFIEIGLRKNNNNNLQLFTRSSEDIGLQFVSEKEYQIENFKQIAFSLVRSYQQTKIYIWYQDKTFEKIGPSKIDVKFNDFQYQLFSNTQSYEIEMFDFQILSNPYPFIMQQKITNFKDTCEIYQVPSLVEYNMCLTCKNGVLNPKDQCVEFCAKDQKNVNNKCAPCEQENCKEIKFPQFIIENTTGLEFKITLDKPLFKKTLQDISKYINVKVSSLKPSDYKYSILPVNQNQIDLQINTEKSIYNSTLEISIDKKQVSQLYTINREKIGEINGEFQVNSLRVLHTYQEMVLDIICSIIIIIFWILVLFGLLLIILQFKYSFEDYSFKRLYYVFVNIQFVSFLAFANVPFPSNLNFFCNKIFEYTVKCFGIIKLKQPQIDRQLTLDLQNLQENNFSVLLVENMTFIALIHLVVLAIYIFTLVFSLMHKICPFKPKNRERLFKTRDVFEFSFLAMSFLVFTPTIFSYLTLDLKLQKKIHSEEKRQISFLISLSYLVIYGLGLVFFFLFYLIKKGFKHHSNIKNKLHFLFNGYQESKNANIYEICQIILTILISVVLTGLTTKQAPQLTFLVFLQILKVVLISCLKPFMSKWDKFAEIFEKFLWTVSFLGVAVLSVFDENKQDQIRVKIGWSVIGIISFQIFCDFISHFMFCLKFVTNMKKPENIIFYQKAYNFKKIEDQQQNNHTLIESQHRGSSFFFDDDKPNDVRVNPYKKIDQKENFQAQKKENKTFISEKQLSEDDNQNDAEFENMKSGQGTLHESYISQSSKSVDKNDQKKQLTQKYKSIQNFTIQIFSINFNHKNKREFQYQYAKTFTNWKWKNGRCLYKKHKQQI